MNNNERRISIGTRCLTIIALALQSCAPVVQAQELPAKDQTSEAAVAATNKAPDKSPTGVPDVPPEVYFNTPSSSLTDMTTETDQPIENRVQIIGVEVVSTAKNQPLLNKVEKNQRIKNLTSSWSLRRNEYGVLTDKSGKINNPDLIPATYNLKFATDNGSQQNLLFVRRPIENSPTDIKQQSYLIVGISKNGDYIDPEQAQPENLVPLPIVEQNGVYYLTDPNNPNNKIKFAQLGDQKGEVYSPFGGSFTFDVADPRMFAFESTLEFNDYGIFPFEQMYKLMGFEMSPNRPVLGNPDQITGLPHFDAQTDVYGGRIYRSLQYYLEVERPDLVDKVLNQNPQVTYKRQKSYRANEEHLLMEYAPKDMTPIIRIYFHANNLIFGTGEAGKNNEPYEADFSMDAIPDKSSRGWGVFIYHRYVNNENYAFSNQPLPNNLIPLEAKVADDWAKVRDQYFISINSTHLAKLRQASQQLTNTAHPNYGIIPDEFGCSIISSYH